MTSKMGAPGWRSRWSEGGGLTSPGEGDGALLLLSSRCRGVHRGVFSGGGAGRRGPVDGVGGCRALGGVLCRLGEARQAGRVHCRRNRDRGGGEAPR